MHGRILIVDDVAANRIIYKVKLAEAYYEPLLAGDGKSCLAIARSERPDLILLDLQLPDIPGTEVLRELRADPATRSIPVVVLTSSRDGEDRLRALSAGADDVMTKPVQDQVLLARVRNLLRSRGEQGFVASAWGMPAHSVLGLSESQSAFETLGSVALIAANPETALRLKHELRPVLRDTLVVMTPDQAMKLLPGEGVSVPEVFVIYAELGDNSGLRLMSELASRSATRHAVACIVTAAPDGEIATVAFDLGADDVVTSGVSPRELALRLRILIRRKRQADRLRATLEDGLKLAVTDPLTGIYNRRYAMPRIAGIAAQAAQDGAEFAVMVVDLDRFKSVNDRFGHAAGDRVLTEMASRLSANLRLSDLLARIGGEEFLVALPNTVLADAERVADRLREVIAERPVTLPSGAQLTVTASIGVAMARVGMPPEDVTDLIDRADKALLRSKASGRNQVTFATRSAA